MAPTLSTSSMSSSTGSESSSELDVAPGVALHRFDPTSASESEWQDLHTIACRGEREKWPDDPPTTFNERKKNFETIPSFVDVKLWLAYRQDRPIGSMNCVLMRTEENQHLLQFDLYLIPEERRQGIGSALMQKVAAEAEAHNRRLLIGDTISSIPAGEAFMQKLGANLGISGDINQLNIADLDRGMLDAWIQKAEERSSDLMLGCWDGAYPAEDIEAIALLKQTMNTAPKDDLDVEDSVITPEQMRSIEESQAARGIQRWTYYVRDPATNAFAGYTELYWKPTKPEMLDQGDTAVVPEYRNRGIGRWLKAAALKDTLSRYPEVKRVRTGNASSNASMLKINYELGFHVYRTWKVWQIERTSQPN